MNGSLVYYYNLFPFLHFELCFFQNIMDFFGVSKVSSSIQKAKHSCSHKRIVQLTAPLNQNEMLPMYPYRRGGTIGHGHNHNHEFLLMPVPTPS